MLQYVIQGYYGIDRRNKVKKLVTLSLFNGEGFHLGRKLQVCFRNRMLRRSLYLIQAPDSWPWGHWHLFYPTPPPHIMIIN
jgi:hypothetical protein